MIKKIDPTTLRQNPYQTRTDLSVMYIRDLVRSIKINGQDEPVEAYVDDDGLLTILEGHRRVLACASLGRKVRCRMVPKPPEDQLLGMIWRRNTVRTKHLLSGPVLKMIIDRVRTENLTKWRTSLKAICQEMSIPYMTGRRAYSLYKRLVINHPRAADRCVKERWGVWEIERFLGGPTKAQMGNGNCKGGNRPKWGEGQFTPVTCDIRSGNPPTVLLTMQPGTDVHDLQDWFDHHGWVRPTLDGVETPRVKPRVKRPEVEQAPN